jgi:hypothetical protein
MFALVLGVTDQSTVLAGGDANVYTMGLPIATVPVEDFWSVGLMGEVSVELSFFRHAKKTIENNSPQKGIVVFFIIFNLRFKILFSKIIKLPVALKRLGVIKKFIK